MKPADERLVGDWVCIDEDSSSCFSFRIEDGRFVVSGVDMADGEAFEMSEATWDGEALSFATYMPSTDWHVRAAFRLLPDETVEEELTLLEIWKKTDDKPGEKGLEGRWVTFEEDSNVAVTIKWENGQYTVSAATLRSGEDALIEDVEWDGTALSFRATFAGGEWAKNVFRLLPDGTAELELTEPYIWERKLSG